METPTICKSREDFAALKLQHFANNAQVANKNVWKKEPHDIRLNEMSIEKFYHYALQSEHQQVYTEYGTSQ